MDGWVGRDGVSERVGEGGELSVALDAPVYVRFWCGQTVGTNRRRALA